MTPRLALPPRGVLIALDPGLRKAGLAIYQDGSLSHALTVRSHCEDDDVATAAAAMARSCADAVGGWALPYGSPATWVVETQQHYAGKSVAADLVALTTATGWILGVCVWPNSRVHLVLPRVWKGQLKKEIVRSRVQAILNADELAAFRLPDGRRQGTADRASHDAWDAVALGAWALGRW